MPNQDPLFVHAALILLGLIIAGGALASLRDWRAGMWFWLLAGVLQDPVRKILPGTPPILTLSFTPIYFAMFAGLLAKTDAFGSFRRKFPELVPIATLFCMTLVVSFAQTLSYGRPAYSVAVLGLFSYVGGVPAILLGFQYVRRSHLEVHRVLYVLMGITTVMLTGVFLEYMEVRLPVPALGTIVQREWLRWVEGHEMRMISGFYRTPEIMGWHAMTLVMLGLYFMVRRPSFTLLWWSLMGLGGYAVLLSCRRKMFLALLVYVAALIIISRGAVRRRLAVYAAITAAVIVPVLLLVTEHKYLLAAQTGLTTAGAKAAEKGFAGPMWLVNLVGPFGFGVGTKSQGTQHLDYMIQTPLVEGGFEKILVEVGVVGVTAACLLLIMLVIAAARCIRYTIVRTDDNTLLVGIAALLCANLATFVISFQTYGDPFIVSLLGFLFGVLLSVSRVPSQPSSDAGRDDVPMRRGRNRRRRTAEQPRRTRRSTPPVEARME